MKILKSIWLMMSVFVLWLLNVWLVFPQVREAWVARYGNPENLDFAGSICGIAVNNQDKLIVSGNLNIDYVALKYDTDTGQNFWTARLDSGYDFARGMAVDRNGNVIVTGSSRRPSSPTDYLTVKYDGRNGERIWIARYDGTARTNDNAIAVAIDSRGDVFVTGGSDGVGTSSDYLTIKYDGRTGEPLWIARYSTSASEIANAIAVDAMDDVYVTGSRGTIKYDGQTGQTLWGPVMSGNASTIVVDYNDNVFVTGSATTGSNSMATYKLNGRQGQRLWGVISLNAVIGGARAIALDSKGDVIVCGGAQYLHVGRVEKYASQNGQVVWSVPLQGLCLALAIDGEDNVYVTGSSVGFTPAPIGDFRTVKLDGRNGRLLWQRTYPNAQGQAITVDEHGGVYVSGVEGPDNAMPLLTIKYEQAPPGDVNYDFCVDDRDLLRILDTFGQSGDLPEDVNRDGVVNDKDLLTVLFNFGRGCGGD